jgi:hypothetical protein
MSGATWPCPACGHPLMSFARARAAGHPALQPGTVIGCAECRSALRVTGENQAEVVEASPRAKAEIERMSQIVQETRGYNDGSRDMVIGPEAQHFVAVTQAYRRTRANMHAPLRSLVEGMLEQLFLALTADEQVWAERQLSQPEA